MVRARRRQFKSEVASAAEKAACRGRLFGVRCLLSAAVSMTKLKFGLDARMPERQIFRAYLRIGSIAAQRLPPH